VIPFVFDRLVLAKTLRAVRRFSGLKQAELAERLHKRPRSYQHFEGGNHKVLDVAALYEVARATGADPYGILLATLASRPEIAVRFADNKLVSAFVIAFVAFNDAVGDEAANLSAAEIVAAFHGAFKQLAHQAGRPYPEG